LKELTKQQDNSRGDVIGLTHSDVKMIPSDMLGKNYI